MGRPRGSQNYPVELKRKIILAHEKDREGATKLSKRFVMPLSAVKKILEVSELLELQRF